MYRIHENYMMNMMCLGDEDTGELDVQNTGELHNEQDVLR